jgi:iron complex transport system substrate-binding protein
VFLEISHRPLMTVGGRHFITEALGICGAANVFGDLAEVAPVVSWEELYAREPDAILGAGRADGEAAFRREWAARPSLGAVGAGRVGYVPTMALGRPSPRVADGIEALCLEVERLRSRRP